MQNKMKPVGLSLQFVQETAHIIAFGKRPHRSYWKGGGDVKNDMGIQIYVVLNHKFHNH